MAGNHPGPTAHVPENAEYKFRDPDGIVRHLHAWLGWCQTFRRKRIWGKITGSDFISTFLSVDCCRAVITKNS